MINIPDSCMRERYISKEHWVYTKR